LVWTQKKIRRQGVLPGLVRDYNTEVGPALQRMDAMNIRRIAFVLLGASVRPGGS